MKTLLPSLAIMLSIQITAIAQESGKKIEIDKSRILVEQVLTAEEQAALTPTDVLLSLQAGNQRFVRSDLTARDHSIQIRESVAGQYPKAIKEAVETLKNILQRMATHTQKKKNTLRTLKVAKANLRKLKKEYVPTRTFSP